MADLDESSRPKRSLGKLSFESLTPAPKRAKTTRESEVITAASSLGTSSSIDQEPEPSLSISRGSLDGVGDAQLALQAQGATSFQNFARSDISTGGGHVGSYNQNQSYHFNRTHIFNVAVTSAQHEVFRALRPVTDAAYDSSAREFASQCLDNTRVEVLQIIDDWVASVDDVFLFWLNGAAGTGKSTISQSVALRYLQSGRLGASFFFSRDQKERRETRFLFQTLAFQLGNLFPALKVAIAKILEDETILTSNLRRQLEKLLLEPIYRIKDLISEPIVIVLDALDESDEPDAITRIIELIVSGLKDRDLPLKFYISSRPDSHIRNKFASDHIQGATHGLILHDIAPIDVQHDIKVFVESELMRIWKDRGIKILFVQSDVDALVELTAGLFIVAATTLKFIAPRPHSPPVRLQMVIGQKENPRSNPPGLYSHLDKLYDQILDQALRGQEDPEVFGQLRRILGTILLSFSRLSVKELSGLLQMESWEVTLMLEELHSVIRVPPLGEHGSVYAFHASLHDFLTTEGRCTTMKFFIDPSLHHTDIAVLCLQRMKTPSLRRDPCNLRDSSKLNAEFEDLDQRILRFLPGDLLYACRFWALHLRNAIVDESVIDLVEQFMLSSLLPWMEVLSLIGELGRGLESLREVKKALLSKHTASSRQELLQLVYDAERFLLTFYDVIVISAAHIYHSALPFTPRKTLLYRHFFQELEGSPQVLSGVRDHWDACFRVIENPSRVYSIAISCDGDRIAAGSGDNSVRIWDAQTGVLLHELHGHLEAVCSIDISRDGTRIVSGSYDNCVCIWDAQAGTLLQEFPGHLGEDHCMSNDHCVTISSDGTRVISGSNCNLVRVWDAHSGVLLNEFHGNSYWVNSVAVVYDGSRIIVASDDKTVCIWDAQTGVLLNRLEWLSELDTVYSVTLSYDGTRAVSGSGKGNICIWDSQTGVLLRRLEGHVSSVSSVAISHDNICVVSGSADGTVYTWAAQTGLLLSVLRGHSGSVHSVAISHDGTRIVSGSSDSTVRIWDAVTGIPLNEQRRGHSALVRSVAISDDGGSIVSGSQDHSVCLWDAQTGSLLTQFKEHSSLVLSVAISHDGSHVISRSRDGTINIWDARANMLLNKLHHGHGVKVRSIAISRDGNRVVSGSDDKTVRIWNTHTGVVTTELHGHSAMVFSVAISHDGTRIISSSDDKTVCIWDAGTGALLKKLHGHSRAVYSVFISRDGSRIISGSYDKTARIWDTQTGALLHVLTCLHEVFSVSISHDGTLARCNGQSIPVPSSAQPLSSSTQVAILPPELSYSQDGWVMMAKGGRQKLCWLAPAHRPSLPKALVINPPLVVSGSADGRLFILRFPLGLSHPS